MTVDGFDVALWVTRLALTRSGEGHALALGGGVIVTDRWRVRPTDGA